MDRFFVTLDLDWAPDFVVREVGALLAELGIRATWFITHESPEVAKLSGDNRYELGIHPNFVPTLRHTESAATLEEVIATGWRIVPAATSFRSHSLVQASPLLDMMQRSGFTHDCNMLLPFTKIGAVAPWRHCNGMIRVPYVWEDYMWLVNSCRDHGELAEPNGLRVINVHPIHLWLNSDSLARYESVKVDMKDEARLRAARNPLANEGVQTVFIEIISNVDGHRRR